MENKTGKKEFIPFVMAGLPNWEKFEKILFDLQSVNVSKIEVGVCFSDPVADGLTIQKAHQQALEKNINLKEIIEFLGKMKNKGFNTPIVLFSYLNPILKMGYENFIIKAKENGIYGALIVDLPPEEAESYLSLANKHYLKTVFLCSPTTSKERIKKINDCSSGFVYYVLRKGMTGERKDLPNEVINDLKNAKKQITKPICVGFGISNHEHVKKIAPFCDGVIVGSALVKKIDKKQDIKEYVKNMVLAC